MKANMIVDIKYLPEFERRAKKMAKKYRSFIEDYDKFLGSLEENPFQGTSLGMGVYNSYGSLVKRKRKKWWCTSADLHSSKSKSRKDSHYSFVDF